ncbi:hypothetical protein AAFF_G00300550 [Aldrovandia affinis]|uniref:Uncharacterized protein n=1 Tax=Aldrovandia affinis TaxID=143900 RepID=A0AAD7WR89_9TELE|nr:hypothetical protein AAFF_G00300550 [Aldrovandia affinis]
MFKEFQGLLHSLRRVLCLKCPISRRFLQMLEVANRTKEQLDGLLVHFYCYQLKEDQLKHRHMINSVLEQHSVTDAERARVRQLQQQQGSCRLQTDAAAAGNRERRITRVLFDDFDRLTVLLDLHRGHSLFMKPKHIPISVKELKKVDVTDRSPQHSDKGLSVGPHSFESMSKARLHNQHWVEEVYTALREGYVKAGKYLLEKLPLENSTITNLATLSLTMIQHEATRQGLLSLGRSLPNVLDTAQLGQLDAEVRAYQVDVDILNLQRVSLFSASSQAHLLKVHSTSWMTFWKLIAL